MLQEGSGNFSTYLGELLLPDEKRGSLGRVQLPGEEAGAGLAFHLGIQESSGCTGCPAQPTPEGNPESLGPGSWD